MHVYTAMIGICVTAYNAMIGRCVPAYKAMIGRDLLVYKARIWRCVPTYKARIGTCSSSSNLGSIIHNFIAAATPELHTSKEHIKVEN